VPAAAVIPAPIAYIQVDAVKTLVVDGVRWLSWWLAGPVSLRKRGTGSCPAWLAPG